MNLLLTLPYLLFIVLALLPAKTWVIQMPPIFAIAIGGLFLSVTLGLVFFSKFSFVINEKIPFFRKIQNPILGVRIPYSFQKLFLLTIVWVFMLVFPLRDLRFGDGLLLLETNYLETKLFGFQTTLDEMGEAGLHSLAYHFLENLNLSSTTLLSGFSLVSWIVGLCYLAIVGYLIPSRSISHLAILVSSQGILVFFGYAENYSLVSLAIFTTLIYFHSIAKKETISIKDLLIGTILTVFSMYLHLVAGHLVFVLIYLWWQIDNSQKIKSLLLSSGLGLSLLFLPITYFLFLHNPSIDLLSTHLAHPPLYPIKRFFSTVHFWEVVQLFLWSCFFPFCYLVFKWIHPNFLPKQYWNTKENKVYLIGFLAFLFHAIRHNPMLGYPADWDLMGFFWIPLTLLVHSLTKKGFSRELQLLVWFSLLVLGLNAITLSKETESSESDLQSAKQTIDLFVQTEITRLLEIPKKEKKFVAKMDYFYFRNITYIQKTCPSEERERLLTSIAESQAQWKSGYKSGILQDKEGLQVFLKEATTLNTDCLRFLEANTKCHL